MCEVWSDMNTPTPASPAHGLCPPPPRLWGPAYRKSSPHSQSRSQRAVGTEPPGCIREQKPEVRHPWEKGPLPIWSNPGSGPSLVNGRLHSHILPAPPLRPSNTHHTRVPALRRGVGAVLPSAGGWGRYGGLCVQLHLCQEKKLPCLPLPSHLPITGASGIHTLPAGTDWWGGLTSS